MQKKTSGILKQAAHCPENIYEAVFKCLCLNARNSIIAISSMNIIIGTHLYTRATGQLGLTLPKLRTIASNPCPPC